MPTLRELRIGIMLTQVELAELAGVSSTTISHWETGSRRPHPHNIRKLATALQVSPQQILAALREGSAKQDALKESQVEGEG